MSNWVLWHPKIRVSHIDPYVASGSMEVKINAAIDLNALLAATKSEDEIPVNKGGMVSLRYEGRTQQYSTAEIVSVQEITRRCVK